MKEFVEELLYMCSANNEKSRLMYIIIAIALVAMPFGTIFGIIAFIMKKTAFTLIVGLVLAVVEAGLIVWLKKMD